MNDTSSLETKGYGPELGQAAFGCPWAQYEVPTYAEALLLYLLDEVGRTFWNRFQAEWNKHDDPEVPGLEYHHYYWGNDEDEAAKPNFKFEDIEIRWYKYPGRGMSCTKKLTVQEWAEWFTRCLAVIVAQDKCDLLGEMAREEDA